VRERHTAGTTRLHRGSHLLEARLEAVAQQTVYDGVDGAVGVREQLDTDRQRSTRVDAASGVVKQQIYL